MKNVQSNCMDSFLTWYTKREERPIDAGIPAICPVARFLSVLLETCREGVTVTDTGASIIMANKAFTDITGYQLEEVLGQNPRVLKSDRHDKAFYETIWSTLAKEGRWQGEIWNRRKSGEAYPELLTITAIPGVDGNTGKYLAIFNDLSEFKRSQDIILQQLYHDPLTALPNRHLFLDRLNAALRQNRKSGAMTGVICLDLDRFKTVNDSLGHAAGDIMLSEVAARLAGLIKPSDTLSRFGGGVFYFLLANVLDAEDTAHMSGRIQSALSAPLRILTHDLHITASLGIALAPGDGDDAEKLVRNAETAMYRAKETGRNGYHFFTEALGDQVSARLHLENGLRKALDKEEFVLHYQPKVDIHTGRITGMEALVRWITAEGRMTPPDAFIPLAEETGLILPLSDWILEHACRAAARWAKAGHGPLKLAVNLSPCQLQQKDLAQKTLDTLARTGLAPEMLELEITETVYLSGIETVLATLNALTRAGISLALDDFGTGYSSLSYLKRLPISTIKIDKSFVSGLPGDLDDAALVASIISIAKNMNMEVVAEGVETMEQLQFLKAHDFHGSIQGYLFSRPLPANKFVELLERTGGGS